MGIRIELGLVAVLTVGLATTLSAQQVEGTLAPGVSFERELSTGDRHIFELVLGASDFVYGEVEQLTVDVVINVYDPSGKSVGTFDGPSRAPEPFQFTSEVGGTYRIEVTPFEQGEGRYAMSVRRVEPVASTPEERVDQIMAPYDGDDRPGAAVVVMQSGEIVFSRGYGSAQLEYEIPITPSTIFHVASVSKQFTAFAVAMLAEEGVISLDDDIRRFFPELADFGDTITVRHLIHHTSGLRDQWALLGMAGWRLDDVITKDQIMRLLSRQRELNFEPGAEYLYSNSGFTLLAEIVARVTDQSFAEWTAENIFEPLGMENTHFHDDHQMIVPNRAYSYSRSRRRGGFSKAVLSFANVGATSLFTTAEDLARWERNLDSGVVGSADVLRQVHQRGVLNNGDTLGYAFGLGVGEYRGLRRVGHGGADAGFRSYVGRFPDQEFAVIVLANAGDFDAGGRAMEIADIYLNGQFVVTPAEEEDGGESVAGVAEIDPAVFDAYSGDYELVPGFVLTFRRDEGRFFTRATGQREIEIYPSSDSTFFLTEVNARLTFHRESDGSVNRVTLHQGGDRVGTRIIPWRPSPADLNSFVGSYYSNELETTYTLSVRESALVAQHQRHDDIVLNPVPDGSFAGNIWFFGSVEFVRDDLDRVVAMKVSNGRVRNLVFVKQD